ncbi:MAG: type II secretion system F family protein [Thiomicrorhabdus sp.]|nr:type II secretion system F family protein [Thiomicrorhabdus sp.]
MFVVSLLFALGAMVLSIVLYKVITKASSQYQEDFKTTAEVNLSQMFLFIDPDKLLLIGIALAIFLGALVWFLTDFWPLALFVLVLVLISPRFIYKRLQKKRKTNIIQSLPDTLLSMSRSMKAGSSLNQAVEVAVDEDSGPLIQEFSLFLREVRVGVDFNDSLLNLVKRVDAEEMTLVASGMMISREIGGNLADTLDRLADTLRKKIEMEGKIDALTSQGRLQGIVMTLLPFLVGAALFQIEPEHMMRIFYEPIGWAIMAIVIILSATGYFFIRRIVNIDV